MVLWEMGVWSQAPHGISPLATIQTSHSHMSCSTHLNSGAVTAPTCLSSCKSLRVAGVEPADRQGWLWLRVLLIPVAMVVGNGEGGIQNTPQEGYGHNLTEDLPSYRDKSPDPLHGLL